MKNYLATLTVYNKDNIPMETRVVKTKASDIEKAEHNIREYVRCHNTYKPEKDSYVFNGTCFTIDQIELV